MGDKRICPTCLQEINKEHYDSLLEKIQVNINLIAKCLLFI